MWPERRAGVPLPTLTPSSAGAPAQPPPATGSCTARRLRLRHRLAGVRAETPVPLGAQALAVKRLRGGRDEAHRHAAGVILRRRSHALRLYAGRCFQDRLVILRKTRRLRQAIRADGACACHGELEFCRTKGLGRLAIVLAKASRHRGVKGPLWTFAKRVAGKLASIPIDATTSDGRRRGAGRYFCNGHRRRRRSLEGLLRDRRRRRRGRRRLRLSFRLRGLKELDVVDPRKFAAALSLGDPKGSSARPNVERHDDREDAGDRDPAPAVAMGLHYWTSVASARFSTGTRLIESSTFTTCSYANVRSARRITGSAGFASLKIRSFSSSAPSSMRSSFR